jgi:hypothetical protein
MSKYKNRYNTNISFEKEDYDEFRDLLPKGVYISDEINAILKDRILEARIEKSLPTPIEKSAVKISVGNGTTITQSFTKQLSLDIYCSMEELKKHINSIDDPQDAWKLKRNCKLGMQLAETKAKQLHETLPLPIDNNEAVRQC